MDKAAGEENAMRRWGNTGGNGKRQRWDDERIDERTGIVDDGYDNDTDRNDGVGIRDAIARRLGQDGRRDDK